MAWPRPVRSVLVAGEGLLDRLLCVVGALAFSQAPEFMQQYLQRLGGHLDEARRQLEQFRAVAAASGLTLDQLASRTGHDADAGVARLAEVIHGAVARVSTLSADEQAIRSAPIAARPFVFIRHADPAIVRATWHVFRPAFPTTLEGLTYAIIGIVFLLAFYHGAVKWPVRRAWRRRRSVVGASGAVAALLLLAAPLRAQPPVVLSETQVKAAFLFRFTEFVQWPPRAFADAAAPLRIGVAGDDGIADVLRRLARGERWGGHPLEVQEVTNASEAARCQLLYVAPGDEGILRSDAVKDRPILTVGSTDSFARDGGVIRFVPDHSRLRLRINVRAAHAASISISTALLRLAEITEGAPRT